MQVENKDMKSNTDLSHDIYALLAYISENWERIKKEDVTTGDIIRKIDHGFGPYEVLNYVRAEKLLNNEKLKKFRKKVFIARNQGVKIISVFEEEYPPLLREYGCGAEVYPPLVLYRLGKPIPNKPIVAVVGTREPTDIGRKLARKIGAELARRGYVVATGFARGIDEEAVNGAVESGGHVIGVLPYLYENDDLTELNKNGVLRRLVEGGYNDFTAISEHLVKKAELVKRWLAARNRIMSGMSIAVIIPETKYKKGRGWGTIYQVKFGIKAGREVLIMKPQVNDNSVKMGYKSFVKAGAKQVATIDEAIRMVEILSKKLPEQRSEKTLDRWLQSDE